MGRARYSLASEMIQYQKPDLGHEIQSIFEVIETHVKKNLGQDPKQIMSGLKKETNISFDRKLDEVIKRHTGILVESDLVSPLLGAIMVFPFNRNHIFIKDFFRDNYYIQNEKKILKESEDRKGTIDLKEGRVGGIFSTYKHTLYLNVNTLFNSYSLTPEEITAVILHELGHAFTYYEYSNRLSSTNQILASITTDIQNGKSDPLKRTYHFKEVGLILNLSEKEVNDLSNELDSTILGKKLFKLYIGEIKSLREKLKYDETTSEALADNFAVRQGYAKELVTGLDKLHKFSPEKSDFILTWMLAAEFMIDFILIPAALIAILINSVPLAIFYSAWFMIYFLGSGYIGYQDMTYDVLKQRYNRIYLGLVGSLKDSNLPKDDVSAIVKSLDEIQEIIDKTNVPETIKFKLVNFFLPSGRSIRKDILKQQDLEELAYNPIFIETAKLKHNL